MFTFWQGTEFNQYRYKFNGLIRLERVLARQERRRNLPRALERQACVTAAQDFIEAIQALRHFYTGLDYDPTMDLIKHGYLAYTHVLEHRPKLLSQERTYLTYLNETIEKDPNFLGQVKWHRAQSLCCVLLAGVIAFNCHASNEKSAWFLIVLFAIGCLSFGWGIDGLYRNQIIRNHGALAKIEKFIDVLDEKLLDCQESASTRQYETESLVAK